MSLDDRIRALARRQVLLDKLRGFGETGAVAGELMEWEAEPGDSDPLRTIALRRATLRNDLLALSYEGLIERSGTKILFGRRMTVWRARADRKQDEIPAGFRIEWRPDDGWRLSTPAESKRNCRQPYCDAAPVAALWRPRRLRRGDHVIHSGAWWLYCAEHLYGRRINEGRIEFRRLVQVQSEARP